MENKASVSIVLCTYNGEKYVREQIDSLLAQSYPIHEIIIQDDGSNGSYMGDSTSVCVKTWLLFVL